MAIALLRQLEEKSPELARFNIAKMKYLVGDASFKDDIQADCDAGFGPALYLMGIYRTTPVPAWLRVTLENSPSNVPVADHPMVHFISADTVVSASLADQRRANQRLSLAPRGRGGPFRGARRLLIYRY